MNKERRKRLGEAFKAEREHQGLSQRQLAQMAGTSQPHILNIEHGRTNPTYDTICSLADALGRDVKDFV